MYNACNRTTRRTIGSVVNAAAVNYVVVGSTGLAILYATKLYDSFKNETSPPQIYVMTSGTDLTTNIDIEELDYNQLSEHTILKVLSTNRLHFIVSNDLISSNLVLDNQVFESFQPFYTGSGIIGDMIQSYRIPECGPYFTTDTRSKVSPFVKSITVQQDLNKNEMIIATNLASLLNLSPTTSVVAVKPSVLMLNNIFVYRQNNQLERQLFRNEYVELNTHSSVNIVTHVNNLYIQPDSTNSSLNTVIYSTLKEPTTVTIQNACVLWMDNIPDFVKITGISNVPHRKIQVPVFYRYVMSIDLVNTITGVNFTGVTDQFGDGVTSRVTFCCCDVAETGEQMNNSTPTWNVICYTTNQDFGATIETSTFAAEGKTLLIVEAISLQNRRVYEWDSINLSVSVNLNSNETELAYFGKFLLIAANCFRAVTGNVPALPITNVVCNDDGICTDFFPLEASSTRESPLIMTMRLLTSLFDCSTYPTPNTISNSTCGLN